MLKQETQHPEAVAEIVRLKEFFETTPILFKEWKEGAMTVRDIPSFIKLELAAAASFNPKHWFNPPLKRLPQLEQAVKNQLVSTPGQ